MKGLFRADIQMLYFPVWPVSWAQFASRSFTEWDVKAWFCNKPSLQTDKERPKSSDMNSIILGKRRMECDLENLFKNFWE